MITLFRYNWNVREDWFTWCEQLPSEELLRQRTGGLGSILHNLFHIVDVEYSWINFLQDKPEFEEPFSNYQSLEQVKALSDAFHVEVKAFLDGWSNEMENHTVTEIRENGQTTKFTHGEILRHVIAHEIHHIGQLSVWSRELGRKPVTANLIGRGLFEN
ncbi:DinB family protein [Planococcus sp. YIM B11945]|uniref:DinB family protein n=1 Tax=Planococcus sp. YIM B11945 TaxID=3435410 RepID=UPI003D7F088F